MSIDLGGSVNQSDRVQINSVPSCPSPGVSDCRSSWMNPHTAVWSRPGRDWYMLCIPLFPVRAARGAFLTGCLPPSWDFRIKRLGIWNYVYKSLGDDGHSSLGSELSIYVYFPTAFNLHHPRWCCSGFSVSYPCVYASDSFSLAMGFLINTSS